jgi:ABC-2 type transport system permease protein
MSPRLFLRIASVEARRRMSYRVDFWLNLVVGFFAAFGVVYFLWTALFRESGQAEIRGYTLDAMLVYYVAVLLFAKAVRGVDFDNTVSTDIYEGGLNRYLLFPSSYFWFKYAQHVGALLPAILQLVLFGGGFLLFMDVPGSIDVTAGGILMCFGSLALASLLYFTMSFPLQNVAFWADNVWSLLVALRFLTSLLGGALFPLALFPGWIQDVNAWLPFRCLFSVPGEVFIGRMGFGSWAASMVLGAAWCVAIGFLDLLIWRRGTLQYTGVGI